MQSLLFKEVDMTNVIFNVLPQDVENDTIDMMITYMITRVVLRWIG